MFRHDIGVRNTAYSAVLSLRQRKSCSVTSHRIVTVCCIVTELLLFDCVAVEVLLLHFVAVALLQLLLQCDSDVGGQHCPCPVRVSFLSGFSGKSCPVSVRCPDSVRIFCQVSVCPDSACLDSVRCPDSVRIFRKKAVRCLSVRVLSVLILSAVWILSGFLEKMLSGVCLSGFFLS